MDFDGGNDKPRLTAEQKKRNHIESEKKRREAIRAGFERLSKIIPDCEGQARSESIVLQRTVAYLQDKLKQKDSLREQALKKGMSQAEFEKVSVVKSYLTCCPQTNNLTQLQRHREGRQGRADEGHSRPGSQGGRVRSEQEEMKVMR